jgi:uncharacterized protein YecE (DUF72 family)
MPVLIGTSGWQYRDWRGVLYPPGLAERDWLEYYAGRYGTVENNGTFYRLPATDTFAGWRAKVPDGFVMTVKASRYLTHVRRLRDPAEPVARLLRAAAGLGDRLGPVLLQLPPNLRADAAALDTCLGEFARFPGPVASGGQVPATTPGSAVTGVQVPATTPGSAVTGAHVPATTPGSRASVGRVRVAVEFRHESWWTEETRQLLASHNAALCWVDRLGRPLAPLWRTADWGYLRFHEGAAQPWPRYGTQALRSWARRAGDTWPDSADVFVYFNNDQHAAALYDAAAFAAIARQAGRHVTPAPEPGT